MDQRNQRNQRNEPERQDRPSAAQRLADARLRATRTRMLVLEALAAPDCAQADAETLFARFVLAGQGTSMASVYRAVRELERHGLLARHRTGGGRALYRLRAGARPDAALVVTDGAGGFALRVSDAAMYEQLLHWLGTQGLRGQPGIIRIEVEGMQGGAGPLPAAARRHDIFGRVPERSR
ncbi:Fur family transcriptional regulator [Cupriavidus sp. 30B13]|uniref:Fur family transcriptional regulator n=1 Tax=Cupriavidus sp. 30B13 TaxID=3384241 RepID=UPI003B902742